MAKRFKKETNRAPRISKVLEELRSNPCFRKQVEKKGKGKGSYTRKDKHPRNEGVDRLGYSISF